MAALKLGLAPDCAEAHITAASPLYLACIGITTIGWHKPASSNQQNGRMHDDCFLASRDSQTKTACFVTLQIRQGQLIQVHPEAPGAQPLDTNRGITGLVARTGRTVRCISAQAHEA